MTFFNVTFLSVSRTRHRHVHISVRRQARALSYLNNIQLLLYSFLKLLDIMRIFIFDLTSEITIHFSRAPNGEVWSLRSACPLPALCCYDCGGCVVCWRFAMHMLNIYLLFRSALSENSLSCHSFYNMFSKLFFILFRIVSYLKISCK